MTVVAAAYIDGRQRQWPTRDKGAHCGINKGQPRFKRGYLRHNGQNDIYSHVETSGARWGTVVGFSRPTLHQFLRFWSAINFGALLVRLVRQPFFSNFKLACPLCPQSGKSDEAKNRGKGEEDTGF
jgi:hypothetical protein